MNKIYLIFGIAVFTFLSCSNVSRGVELKGKLQNASNAIVAIDILGITGVKPIDSTTTSEKGEFTLKLDLKEPSFCRLRMPTAGNYLIMLINPNEKININADANAIQNNATITGSPETQKMYVANNKLKTSQKSMDSLNTIYQQFARTPAQDSILPILQAEYQNIQTRESQFLKKYISENATSLTCLTYIDKIDKEKDIAVYRALDESLFKVYPTIAYVTDFHKRVVEMSKLMEGSQAPDFTLNTPEGAALSVSSFKGKVLLIDFWASWCGPCRQENPNVVKIYNLYHEKGFEILSVSLDKSKEKWVEAIAKDGLKWNHVSDLGYWSSSVVPLYSITGIPLTVLVDRKGNIVAKSLRGKELESKVAELVSKQ